MSKPNYRYWKGWDDALERVFESFHESFDRVQLTEDQERIAGAIRAICYHLSPDEELLTPQPSNRELAEKYAVSVRTITNWRREECPFESGQWRVLNWMAQRRYVPERAETKFATQLSKRRFR